MEKLYCIIDMKHLSDAHWFAGGTRFGHRLDKQHGPTAFYGNKKDAETELFRLHAKCDGDFAMFELTGYVVESPVTVMAAHIEAPDFDEIPF